MSDPRLLLCVCGEDGSRLERSEGEEMFNLADGGTGTLRVPHPVRHTHLSEQRSGPLSSKHPRGRLGNETFYGAMVGCSLIIQVFKLFISTLVARLFL